MSADTLNATWKNDKKAFGFRMLQKMGWNEDKGLGKNEEGIVKNIAIVKRDEGLGLGVDLSTQDGQNLWNGTVSSFNNVLSVLKESYGGDEKKKKKSSKKKKETISSAGMKYKKIKSAKDLSTKSTEDLTAIFGVNNTTTCEDTEQPKKKIKS